MDEPFPVGMMDCIREFFSKDSERKLGLDLYDDVFKTDLFYPLQRKAEMRRMIQVARQFNRIGPKVVYEIGIDKGGGLYHWCKCLPSVERVIGCEIRGIPYWEEFEKAFPHIRFTWLPGSSRSELNLDHLRQATKLDPIDILFIDGDKGGFVEDFDACLPYLSRNAIVFMHDITDNPTPRDAFESICGRGYATEEIIDRSDSEWAANRQRLGIVSENPYENWLRHWHGRSCGVGVVYLGTESEVHF